MPGCDDNVRSDIPVDNIITTSMGGNFVAINLQEGLDLCYL